MRRTLKLKRETLSELTTEDLRVAVGGGLSGPTCVMVSCPVLNCLSDQIVGCRDLTMGCTR